MSNKMRKLRFLAVMLLSLFLWQSTEIMAAPFAASATVNGKTVNYSYEFTESGGDVTFSITITSITDGGGTSSIVGLVNPTFYDGNGTELQVGGGDINIGSPNTYTWSSQTAGTELSIRAHYLYFEGNFDLPGTGTFNYTVQGGGGSVITAPTDVPTVKAVGKDGIKEVKALYNQGTRNGFTFDPWSDGNSTQKTREAIGDNTIDLFSNFSNYGSNFDEAVNVADWDILHVDIFPITEMGTVAIMPIKSPGSGKGQQFTVTPGQWNSLEIDLKALGLDGLGITSFDQLMFGGEVSNGGLKMEDADGDQKFYVGNIYLYSLETPIPTSVKLYIKGETVSGINMRATWK